LASQIAHSFRVYGAGMPLSTAVVFGGVPIGPQRQKLTRGVDILVATPGRLLDLIDTRSLTLSSVQVLVLDEADRMLDLGFIHALKRIVNVAATAANTAVLDWQCESGGLAGAGLCDAAQIAPAEHRRDGLGSNWRGCRVAFCGERTKDRRGKSKVGEMGQGNNGPLGAEMPAVRSRERNARDRETTRAIGAVQMSAGDKDRSASTASVVRSRRPDHVTLPKSANTALLICWRI